MKQYVKPQVEIIELRTEERIASCSGKPKETLESTSSVCDYPAFDIAIGEAACFDLMDCS